MLAYRQLEAQSFVRLEYIEPAHYRALVIGRASAIQFSGSLGVGSELERLIKPSVLFQSGLNIVVTVNEDCSLHVSAMKGGGQQGGEENELAFLGSLPI